MKIWGGVALALLLSACGGGVVLPRPSQPAPIRPSPARPSPSPAPSAVHAGAVSPMRPRSAIQTARLSAVPVPPPVMAPATAAQAMLAAGPPIATLGFSRQQAADALATFRASCSSLTRRTDASGLTRPDDWKPVCAAAASARDDTANEFFAQWFESVQVGDGAAFVTGYYEPEIAGSLSPREGYAPIYRKPDDLVDVDLGLFSADLKGKHIRGRVDGQAFVPYFDRAAIDRGALDGRGLELAYAADPIELFFLEVQGSGRLRLPDGSILRLGYAGQNGRDYVGIGSLMRQRGLLAPGSASMQGIMAWLREHPAEGRAIMEENKSYVFFRELSGPGPLGALGVAVTGEMSAAADVKFVPLGAPVFLSLDRPEASGLWVTQDTGGAIKGPNRFDTFWGAGERARQMAGGMTGHGTAFLLLPRGTLARLAPRAPLADPTTGPLPRGALPPLPPLPND